MSSAVGLDTIWMDDVAPYGTYAPQGIVRWVVEHTRSLSDNWASWRLLFVLRRLAIRALNGAPVDVDALGARMRLYPYNNICEKKVLFTPQFFDPEELDYLRGRLKDGFTFVDVGSNIGPYALFVAAHAGPSARILAIEPLPDVFDRLTYNIRLNPFGTIKAVACAAADKSGELTMFLDERNSGGSGMKIVGSGKPETVRVPARPLLDLVREEGFSRLDAVKLDTEGAEDIILEPFLRNAEPELLPKLLMFQDSSRQWQTDLPRLLESHGYRLVLKTRMNYVYERP
jgi:FkbM family methyltransferase